ncbi:MAG: FAD-dependent oxidoreductase, partial [Pigmentiphaga sp.]
MKSNMLARRSLLKLAGLIGTGVYGALQTGAAWAQAGTAKLTVAARPAELADFKGEIITRADPSYLGWFWAMTWYRIKPRDQFPIMFARPTGKQDLSVLMAYANKAKVQLMARSSGHNISNTCLVKDAITVDMSMFDQIEEIDTEGRTVWAGPRVLSEPLNRQLFEKGLAFPSAHTGFVTIGGYLLG